MSFTIKKGGASAFRDTQLGGDDLAQLAQDLHVPASVRAAAAYGWLHVAPDQAKARLGESLCEASPPLLVAMVALASPDKRLVPSELLSAALAYLDEDIRKATLDALRTR